MVFVSDRTDPNIPLVYAQHTCSIHAAYLQHTCSRHAAYLHHARQHTCSIPTAHMHHTCNIPATYLHHTCTIPAPYAACLCFSLPKPRLRTAAASPIPPRAAQLTKTARPAPTAPSTRRCRTSLSAVADVAQAGALAALGGGHRLLWRQPLDGCEVPDATDYRCQPMAGCTSHVSRRTAAAWTSRGSRRNRRRATRPRSVGREN